MNRFPSPDSADKPGFKFKGEDALMTEINYLAEGQKKPVVYFTQGNGELDLQVGFVAAGPGVRSAPGTSGTTAL